MVIAHHRRTIATHRDGKRISIQQRIVDATHHGSQGWVFVVAIRSAVWTGSGSTDAIIVIVIVGDTFGGSPEPSLDVLLILSAEHCLQGMDAPTALIVQRDIAQPLLALELATIEIALCPNPSRTKLVVLVGRIGVSAKSCEGKIIFETFGS